MMSCSSDDSFITPSSITILEGQTDKLQCHSVKFIQWRHEGSSLPANTHTTGQYLYITNIQESNKGIYECKGTTPEGDIFYAKAIVIIKGTFYYDY